MRMNVCTMDTFYFLQPSAPHGCEWNANFRCSFDFYFFFFYLIAFNQLGRCFVRWQRRELLHAVQIFEEVTWGWGRSNDNIGLHSSGDSSCVDTRQNGDVAKAPLCVCECVCVYSWWKHFKWRARGIRPEADRSSASRKRKQNRNCKAKSAARGSDSWRGKTC